ncbi:hypothetical protein AAHA92_08434 [Salvia divinorum]|uniref:Uncharacterized protein n=1 Tax=Salvia divinorum TaxID=28513 RepID=A0ABD1HN93_SALDI
MVVWFLTGTQLITNRIGRQLKGQQASKLHKPFKPALQWHLSLDNCFYEWTCERRSLNFPEVSVVAAVNGSWYEGHMEVPRLKNHRLQ